MASLSPKSRQAILDAADKLFAARKFDEVKMEDVAKEADIGKVTLYRYFSTKEELYFKLLESKGVDYIRAIREADASVRGCRNRLIALVRASMTFLYERPHLINLLDRAGIDSERKQTFPWFDVQQQLFRMLQGLLAEGVARKEFDVDDLEIAVRAMLGAMRVQFIYPCQDVTKDDVPEKLVGMLIRLPGKLLANQAA